MLFRAKFYCCYLQMKWILPVCYCTILCAYDIKESISAVTILRTFLLLTTNRWASLLARSQFVSGDMAARMQYFNFEVI